MIIFYFNHTPIDFRVYVYTTLLLPGEASIDLICLPVSTSHILIMASRELDAISLKSVS